MNKVVLCLVSLLFAFGSVAQEDACKSANLLQELSKIVGVGELHNCTIEVLHQRNSSHQSVSLRMQNNNTCNAEGKNCVEVLIGMKIKNECFSGASIAGRLSFSSHYNLGEEQIISFVNMKKDRFGNIMHLDAGEFSTEAGFLNRVLCKVD